MANTIKIKNSGTASNVPSSLEHGELAINYADGLLFYKNSSNVISQFSSGGGASVTISDTAPSSPSAGDLWYESDTGDFFVYYDSYWVELGADPPSSSFLSDLDGDTLIQLEESNDEDKIRFDTAGSERMIIDSSGNVGIGTALPDYPLDVNGKAIVGGGDNQTPDALGNGHLMIAGAGYTGFASLDGTAMWVGHNSGSRSLYLATDETARVTVTGGGNVGIGTTSPAYKLDVNGTGAFRDNVALFDTTNSAGSIGTTGGTGSSNRVQITGNRGVGGVDIQTNGGLAARFNYNKMVYLPYVYSNTTASSVNMHVATDGNLFRSTSSQKYKTDIEDIGYEYADLVLQMRPVWYRSLCENDPSAWSYYGLIAEEVAELDPRLVHYGHKDGCECPEDESGIKQHEASCFVEPEGVQYDRIVPHLINIVQRQQSTIETLTARIETLEAG